MISPYSLRPLSGILAHFNLSNWRAIALLKAFGFLRFEARFEFPVYSRASAGVPPSSPTSTVEIACPQVQAAQR